MLKLRRFKGEGFYLMPPDVNNKKPVFELWVRDIDPDGQWCELEVKGSDNDRKFILSDEAVISPEVFAKFSGVYQHRGRLSVTIAFDIDRRYRIIRDELLANEVNRVGGA